MLRLIKSVYKFIRIRKFRQLNRDIRKLKKYRDWRNYIVLRDKGVCQYCHKRKSRIEVHHIKPFINIIVDNKIRTINQAIKCKQLWNTKNGIVLCTKCHSKEKNHKRYIPTKK